MGSKWEKIRFHPSIWCNFTNNLSRYERAFYLEMCVHYWNYRSPMSLAEIQLSGDEELLSSLISRDLLLECDGGYLPRVIMKMKGAGTALRLSSAVWRRTRQRVFERDGFACQYCGSKDNLECDHVVPLSRGGSHEDDNLKTACRPCNRSKCAKTLEEFSL